MVDFVDDRKPEQIEKDQYFPLRAPAKRWTLVVFLLQKEDERLSADAGT